jgi:predicted SAM-dependent methyltransferase
MEQVIRKLEICSGPDGGTPGYEHNDINPGPHIDHPGPAQELIFPEATFDEIYGTGAFEHFTYWEAGEFLRRAIVWLKPGGFLDINVPDISKWIQHIVRRDTENKDAQWVENTFLGWRRFPGDAHLSWWSPDIILGALEAAGFVDMDVYRTWAYQGESDWHVCVRAYRPVVSDVRRP